MQLDHEIAVDALEIPLELAMEAAEPSLLGASDGGNPVGDTLVIRGEGDALEQRSAGSNEYGIHDGMYAAELDRLVNSAGSVGPVEYFDGSAEDVSRANDIAVQDSRILQLTEVERRVLQCQKYLPDNKINGLLAALSNPTVNVCRWRTAGQLYAWVNSVPILGQKWKEDHLLSFQGTDARIYEFRCRYVEEITEVLQHFMLLGGALSSPSLVKNQQGERLYGRVALGTYIEEKFKQYRLYYPGKDFMLIPFGLYMDSTKLKKAQSHACPLQFTALGLPSTVVFTHRGTVRIADVPIIRANTPIPDKARSSYQGWIVQATVAKAVEGLKRLSYTGVTLKDASGQPHLAFPVLVSIPGDLQAQAQLLMVSTNWKCKMPDISHLVPQSNLDDVGGVYKRRTEAETLHVLRSARARVEAAASSSPAERAAARSQAEAELAKISVSKLVLFDPKSRRDFRFCTELDSYGSVVRVPALSGFFLTDIYLLPGPCRLHILIKGLGEYLILPSSSDGKETVMSRLLAQSGRDGAMRQVNKYLSPGNHRSYPGLVLPSQGLDTPIISGEELKSILVVIGPALLLDEIFAPLIPAVIVLLEFLEVLTYEIHTDATIAKGRTLGTKLQKTLLELERGGQEWKIPKFFSVFKFLDFIAMVASTAFTDTSTLEALHKNLKPGTDHTNNRINQMAPQISKYAEHADAARRITDALEESKIERQSMEKRALQTGRLALPSLRAAMPGNLHNLAMDTSDPETQELLRLLPDLEHLEFSVQEYCISVGRAMPRRVLLYANAGLPWYHRLGAPAEGIKLRTALGDKQKFHAVAVRSGNYTHENPEEWFGDLLAFVVLDYGGTIRSNPMVFVRWYVTDQNPGAGVENLKMPPLKVEQQQREKRGGGVKTVAYTDLVSAHDILRPVLIQPNPLKTGKRDTGYLYNPFAPVA